MAGRGGPQQIPRPAGAYAGRPAPWANCTAVPLGLDSIADALARPRAQPDSTAQPPVRNRRRSAVLVALYVDAGETMVILTRRSQSMRQHTGEVSFPGGRSDPGDRDDWHTAIREAHEEIALDPSTPRPVGRLDPFVTVGSASLLHPVVGVLADVPRLVANPAEVDRILRVSLAELLLPEVFREERWPIGGTDRPVSFFELHGDTVWGATGSVLRQLLGVITGTEPTLVR